MTSAARSGGIPEPTVKSGWEKALSLATAGCQALRICIPEKRLTRPKATTFGRFCMRCRDRMKLLARVQIQSGLRVISTVLYRLLYMLGVMVAVVTIVFAMIHLSGDPLDALVPPGSSPEDVQVLREKYGLDESLANQYVRFLSNAARGDFGLSWRSDEPARDVVFDRLPATLELVGLSFGLALLIAIPLGVMAGQDQDG